jgi:hypothetical protein
MTEVVPSPTFSSCVLLVYDDCSAPSFRIYSNFCTYCQISVCIVKLLYTLATLNIVRKLLEMPVQQLKVIVFSTGQGKGLKGYFCLSSFKVEVTRTIFSVVTGILSIIVLKFVAGQSVAQPASDSTC